MNEIQGTIALLAVFLSIVGFAYNRNYRKRDLVIDLWTVWMSSDYRRFRVVAMRAIKGDLEHSKIPNDQKPYSEIAKDLDIEIAIGSIEHFMIEMSSLKSRGMLCEKLLAALFEETIKNWKEAFDSVERNPDDSRKIKIELEEAFSELSDNKYHDYSSSSLIRLVRRLQF